MKTLGVSPFMRQKFQNNLPSPSTIRKWLSNSCANGKPGLTQETLNTLQQLVDEHKSNNSDVYCTLSFDEMSIRRNVQWSETQKKWLGHITYGSIDENAEYLPVANNVITFMVNGVNVKFNLPVAFHFINSLNSGEKSSLILMVLQRITAIGIKIIAITFDGLTCNLSTCALLGADLKLGANFKPYFINPSNDEKIYIIFDPPHMVKLLRNVIGDFKEL